MSGLDKFETVSASELSKVVGGDDADYNSGYEIGRHLRRMTNGIVSWWHRHV